MSVTSVLAVIFYILHTSLGYNYISVSPVPVVVGQPITVTCSVRALFNGTDERGNRWFIDLSNGRGFYTLSIYQLFMFKDVNGDLTSGERRDRMAYYTPDSERLQHDSYYFPPGVTTSSFTGVREPEDATNATNKVAHISLTMTATVDDGCKLVSGYMCAIMYASGYIYYRNIAALNGKT